MVEALKQSCEIIPISSGELTVNTINTACLDVPAQNSPNQ